MKTIKAIKQTKHAEVGDVRRVTDIEADEKVGIGYWEFVPKSEWKQLSKKIEQAREKYPANVEGSEEFNKSNKTKKQKK